MRDKYCEQMFSSDLNIKFNAFRSFYKHANGEIYSAGMNEWGIDPYEANWVMLFTPIEEALWHDIRGCDAVLYPQYPVGKYFVDFANPVAKVAIECDGAAYHTDKAKDAARQREIESLGWSVFRITGSDCIKDFDEENMKSSVPRKLITKICSQYGIGRP